MRGMISIDWIVGITVFLVFASMAIFHASNLTQAQAQPLLKTSDLFAGRIMDSLLLDVREVPVIYDSPSPQTDGVLWLNFTWPFGRNTTRILSGSTALPCIIQDSVLYWQASMTAGINNFTLTFSDQNTSMNCSGSFSTSTENQTIPWSGESLRLLSQDRIDQMMTAGYSAFRSGLGIDRNFMVKLDINGSESSLGPEPPLESNVFVKNRWGRLFETGEKVSVILLFW